MSADSAMPVPAASSLAEEVLRDRLADVGGDGELPGLLGFLAAVPDPRRVRGRRHPLAAILALACTATVAGCRSLTAIAEHAAGASQEALAAAGVTRRDRRGRAAVPSETTIRRALARADPQALDAALRGWRAACGGGRDELVAIDGKTARGAAPSGSSVRWRPRPPLGLSRASRSSGCRCARPAAGARRGSGRPR